MHPAASSAVSCAFLGFRGRRPTAPPSAPGLLSGKAGSSHQPALDGVQSWVHGMFKARPATPGAQQGTRPHRGCE